MEGYKITTVFAIVFVFAACINGSIAKDVGRKEKVPETSVAKDKKVETKIEECVIKKCKPAKGQQTADVECTLGCLKAALHLEDKKIDMNQLEKEMTAVVRDLFCFVGCATSGMCPDDDKNQEEADKKCIIGCSALCMANLPKP